MSPKNDEIKQEKHQDFVENFETYTQLVLETLNDKDFKKYTEFSYLISKPEYHLLTLNLLQMLLFYHHQIFCIHMA